MTQTAMAAIPDRKLATCQLVRSHALIPAPPTEKRSAAARTDKRARFKGFTTSDLYIRDRGGGPSDKRAPLTERRQRPTVSVESRGRSPGAARRKVGVMRVLALLS